MTIEVKQTCDGCGGSRDINLPTYANSATIIDRAEVGGWKQIMIDPDSIKHLCPKCIKKALKKE